MADVEFEFRTGGAARASKEVGALQKQIAKLEKELANLVAQQEKSVSVSEKFVAIQKQTRTELAATGVRVVRTGQDIKNVLKGFAAGGPVGGAIASAKVAIEELVIGIVKFGTTLVKNVGLAIKSLFSLRNQIIGIGAALGFAFSQKQFIDVGIFVEGLTAQFKFLFGSAQAAQREFEKIIEFTEITPFEVPNIAQATKDLKAVGALGNETIKILAGAAVAAQIDITAATNAFISATNRSFRPLRQFGILARASAEEVRFAFVTASGRMREVVTKNNQAMINSTLSTILDERFSGALVEFEGLWVNLFSNLTDRWFNFRNFVANQLGVLDFGKGLLAGALEFFDRNLPTLERFGKVIADSFNASFTIIGKLLGAIEFALAPLVRLAEDFSAAIADKSALQLITELTIAYTLMGDTGVKAYLGIITVQKTLEEETRSFLNKLPLIGNILEGFLGETRHDREERIKGYDEELQAIIRFNAKVGTEVRALNDELRAAQEEKFFDVTGGASLADIGSINAVTGPIRKLYDQITDELIGSTSDAREKLIEENAKLVASGRFTGDQIEILGKTLQLKLAQLRQDALLGDELLTVTQIATRKTLEGVLKRAEATFGIGRIKAQLGDTEVDIEGEENIVSRSQRKIEKALLGLRVQTAALKVEGPERAIIAALGAERKALLALEVEEVRINDRRSQALGRATTERSRLEAEFTKEVEKQRKLQRTSSQDLGATAQRLVTDLAVVYGEQKIDLAQLVEDTDLLDKQREANKARTAAALLDIQRSLTRNLIRLEGDAETARLEGLGQDTNAAVNRIKVAAARQEDALEIAKKSEIALRNATGRERVRIAKRYDDLIEKQTANSLARIQKLREDQARELTQELAVLSQPDAAQAAVSASIQSLNKLNDRLKEFTIDQDQQQQAWEVHWAELARIHKDGSEIVQSNIRAANIALLDEQTRAIAQSLEQARERFRQFREGGVPQDLALQVLTMQVDLILAEADRGQQALRDLAAEANDALSTGLAGAFTDAITGAESLKQSMGDLLQTFADRALNIGLQNLFDTALAEVGSILKTKEGSPLGDLFGTSPDTATLEKQAADIISAASVKQQTSTNLFDLSVKQFGAEVARMAMIQIPGAEAGTGLAAPVAVAPLTIQQQSQAKTGAALLGQDPNEFDSLGADLRKAAGLQQKAADTNVASATTMNLAGLAQGAAGAAQQAAGGDMVGAGISMLAAAIQLVIAAAVDSFSAHSGGVTTSAVGSAGIPARIHANEAIIPLDRLDAMIARGSGGGDSGVQIAQSITINADGRSQVSTDAGQGDAESSAQLGRLLNEAVIGVLVQQQRPGGVLNRRRR